MKGKRRKEWTRKRRMRWVKKGRARSIGRIAAPCPHAPDAGPRRRADEHGPHCSALVGHVYGRGREQREHCASTDEHRDLRTPCINAQM